MITLSNDTRTKFINKIVFELHAIWTAYCLKSTGWGYTFLVMHLCYYIGIFSDTHVQWCICRLSTGLFQCMYEGCYMNCLRESYFISRYRCLVVCMTPLMQPAAT